jgi:hypothetical protein
MTIYIALSQVEDSAIEIIGVFDDPDEALQRCRDFDKWLLDDGCNWVRRFWVETWKLGAVEATDIHQVSLTEMVHRAGRAKAQAARSNTNKNGE